MSDLLKANVDANFVTPEKRAFEIRRRAGAVLHSRIEGFWEEAQIENKKTDFINILKEKVSQFIPEAAQEADTAFDVLETLDETEKNNILDQATEITTKLIAKYLTLEDLEERLRTRQAEFDQQELSRGLTFDVDKENNKINLHIPVTFFEDPKSAIQSMLEGLKVLANRLKTDDELKGIDEIVGYSSLVREKRRLLTKYGFDITMDEDGKPTDEVKISKAKFLEKFG